MIVLYCHDATPAKEDEKHGIMGPTHCATVRVDYEYQAEMWVQDIQEDYPQIVRIDVPTLNREWKRVNGTFQETSRAVV